VEGYTVQVRVYHQAIQQNGAHGEEKTDRLATALIATLADEFLDPAKLHRN
jgi:hypothetical protein